MNQSNSSLKWFRGFRENIKSINAGRLTDNRCQVMEIAYMDISSRWAKIAFN
jgi:hypothetical protein